VQVRRHIGNTTRTHSKRQANFSGFERRGRWRHVPQFGVPPGTGV